MKVTRDYVREMYKLNKQITELKAILDGMKDEVKKQAAAEGVKSYQWEELGVELREKHSTRLDGKALKAAFPAIYDQFVTSSVSTSLYFK